METVDLTQGSRAWLDFRRSKIGASDSAAVMAESPWMTPLMLWMEKRGLKTNEFSGPHIQKGVEVEPLVRTYYGNGLGVEFVPVVMSSKEYPFMAASFDGVAVVDGKARYIEIKVPSEEVFQMAKDGRVHPKYIWQLEHQMIVSGAECIHFLCAKASLDENARWVVDDVAEVVYKSNPKKRSLLIEKEKSFWSLVISGTPPPLTDQDVLERTEPEVISQFAQMNGLMKILADLRAQLAVLEEQEGILRAQMITGMKHVKERASGVQITKVKKATGNAVYQIRRVE